MIKVTAETITAAVTVKAIFFAFVFPENTASRILPQIRHTSHAIGNRITDISALMDASDRINIATEASNSNAAAAERHIAVTLPPLCAIFGSDGIDSIAKSHNTEEITPSAAATNRTPNIPIGAVVYDPCCGAQNHERHPQSQMYRRYDHRNFLLHRFSPKLV